jgi:ADP-L-glycero-D-manno-heptose 6-epimerase
MFIVTGGAGFIGSRIAARLAAQEDARVIVADRLRQAPLGKWRNIAKHAIADIVAPEDLFGFLEQHWRQVRAVVHMGAVSATTQTDVDAILEANLRLSQKLWVWCAARQKPFVYASSAAAYGDGAQGFSDDNSAAAITALRPLNAYGWSKRLFDLYAVREAAAGRAPPRWAGLRFFNVYGPNEYHKGAQQSVVAHMHNALSAGEPVRLFKSHRDGIADGEQKRDFVHVDDCAAIADWLARHDVQAGIVNVGLGQARSFLDLSKALFAALDRKHTVDFIDTPEAIRDKYQYFTQADLTRLRSLGYDQPAIALEAGVLSYVRDHLNTNDPYA